MAAASTLEGLGYVALRGFLEADELPALQAEVDAVLAEPLGPGCERPNNTLIPLRWNDAVVDRVLGSGERTQRLAACLGADDLRWISGYVSVKEPRSAALWWHQDWWCWDHPVSYRRAACQVAVLCYLSVTDPSNGALRLLPGPHRRSVELHAALPQAHTQEATKLDEGHVAMRDQNGQVTFASRPGDAVATDYRLLHATHPNTTAERRDCLLLTFAPSWSTLPADIRGHLIQHPAQPSAGERLPGESWHRSLLPDFRGPRRDLPLNRVAPHRFAVSA